MNYAGVHLNFCRKCEKGNLGRGGGNGARMIWQAGATTLSLVSFPCHLHPSPAMSDFCQSP